MSLYIVDIHGDIEGDYEIIKKYEESTTNNDLGVDCISRTDALHCLTGQIELSPSDMPALKAYLDYVNKRINDLPSVYPKSDNPCDNCALNDGECNKKDICPKGVCAYTPSYPKSDASDCKLEDLKDNALDLQAVMLNDLWKANRQLKKQIEMLKLDRDCEKPEMIPLDKVLEILGDYKLRIPPTVYYELKADVVDMVKPQESEDKE